MHHRFIMLIIAATLSTVVAACGDKETADNAAQQPDTTTVEAVMPETNLSAEEIREKVESALQEQEALAGVGVRSDEHGVIVLTGSVAGRDLKFRALTVASAVDGVIKVTDSVTVTQ